MSNIIVIGAGVIGLSSALRLQQAGYRVIILARDFPSPSETVDKQSLVDYASHWAGAHNRWVIPANEIDARDHAFSVFTYHRMEETFKNHPEAGITFMKGIEYFEAPPPQQRALTDEKAWALGIQEFRLLEQGEFPDDKVAWGCEYKTWSVNPMVYCSFLLRQFTLLGGQVIKRELRHLHEGFLVKTCPGARTVINCSGVGFNDPAVFPTRGQTCIVSNPCDATVTRQNADGTWSFCIPRGFHGGTIIGGTKEPDNWDAEPSPQTHERLLRGLSATYPPIVADGPLCPLSDIVGRRPTRHGGMRLEREEIPGDGIEGLVEPGMRRVIHAYGLGGRGYELSWGVAEAVFDLVKQ